MIGGGVNGTGVARDLALRGLRVVLFERNDFAFGASGTYVLRVKITPAHGPKSSETVFTVHHQI